MKAALPWCQSWRLGPAPWLCGNALFIRKTGLCMAAVVQILGPVSWNTLAHAWAPKIWCAGGLEEGDHGATRPCGAVPLSLARVCIFTVSCNKEEKIGVLALRVEVLLSGMARLLWPWIEDSKGGLCFSLLNLMTLLYRNLFFKLIWEDSRVY